MCGIHGSTEKKTAEEIARHQRHRGNSGRLQEADEIYIGNRLHSVVGDVKQPLGDSSVTTANCEIYNWRKLREEHGVDADNDAEALHRILNRKEEVLEALEDLDGIYAFAHVQGGDVFLGRDRFGVNPLWYCTDPFAFASERQALEKAGLSGIRELHPRRVLKYDTETQELSFRQREFPEVEEKNTGIEEAAEEIHEGFLEAVEKRVPDTEVALLLSGGLDSTMIAAALKKLGKDFTAYTAGIQHGNVNAPRDREKAEMVAEEMDIELESYEADLEEVRKAVPKLSDWLSTTNYVKLSVALPIHFSLAHSGDEKVVFSGFGSEQLYAGYSRQQGYLNKECLSDLRGVFHEDLYRDNVTCFRNGRELRVPFLDEDLVKHALTVPAEMKRKDGYRKYVLRKAAEKMDVPQEVVWREKVAAQYGSNFEKALDRISTEEGFDRKQEYCNSFRDEPNRKLVALTSGGKDSNAAAYRMQRRNNEISCLLTLDSENRESYMFDSRKDSVVKKQAETLGKPLIEQETAGEKEKELEDLLKGLRKAREVYGVDGVVAGAIESTYQRDRVDKIAEKVGLKVFTPLWQWNQKDYMRWLIREGFKVEIVDTAARGIDESWKGKVLDEEKVEDLIDLSEEYRFNAAGEGGEYETRVRGFPQDFTEQG
jgi:asparagine synthase (glutamine-hydrolysing)